MSKILESGFESVVLTLLAEMGFSCHGGDAFDPDATGERESYHGAMLAARNSWTMGQFSVNEGVFA